MERRRRCPAKGHASRGLSLGETVLGATVLALVLLSVLTLLPATMGLVQRNREMNVAHYLAHDTLEMLAARPFASLDPGPQDLGTFVVPEPYSLTATVGPVDGYSDQRLKRIQVVITWPYRDRTLTVQQELLVHGIRR